MIFAKYLTLGGALNKEVSLRSMLQYNRDQASTPRKSPKGRSNDDGSDDQSSGMMKPSSTDLLPKYSNDPTKFEHYWKTVQGRLRQTAYGQYLDHQPKGKRSTNMRAYNQDKALHWMLFTAFQSTDGEHVIKEAEAAHGESGYFTSKALLKYYRSAGRRADVQRQLREKIESLMYDGTADGETSIDQYINNFKINYQLLSEAKEHWTDSRKKDQFLKGIQVHEGHPIHIVKTMLDIDTNAKYIDAVTRIKSAADKDDARANAEMTSKSRRINIPPTRGGEATPKAFPDLPDHLIKSMRASNGQQAVGMMLKWKKVLKEEGRHIRPDELVPPTKGREQVKDSSTKKRKGKFNPKERKKQRRVRFADKVGTEEDQKDDPAVAT
jgi:hypothetical protein